MIEEYYPSAEVDVKAEVISFLEKARGVVPVKSDDVMEANEAIWLMEASSNYLMNVNLDLPSDDVQTFTIDIPTTETDGILKMQEEDVIENFNQFRTQVNNIEIESNQKAKIADYVVKSSDLENIKIEVNVVLGEPQIDLDPESTNCFFTKETCVDNPYVKYPTHEENTYPITYTAVEWWQDDYNQNYLCTCNPDYDIVYNDYCEYTNFDYFFTNLQDLAKYDEYGDPIDIFHISGNDNINNDASTEAKDAANAGYDMIQELMCTRGIPLPPEGAAYGGFDHIGYAYAKVNNQLYTQSGLPAAYHLYIQNLMVGKVYGYYD